MEDRMTPEQMERIKHQLFQALQTRSPLRYYLDTVHDATGLELNLCDTSYGFLAKVPTPEAEDPDLDVDNGRGYLKFDLSMSLELNQHIARSLELPGTYVCQDNRFPYDIAFRPVRINRAMVAYLFSPGRPEGFSPQDLDLIDYLGQILAIELQKNDGFAVENGLKYEYFLQELTIGHFSSDEFAEQRLRQLGYKPQPYYFMLYFSFDDVGNAHATQLRYYELLHNILPDGMGGAVKGRLCMLLPRDNPAPFHPRERQALLNFLEFNQMRCGVSYCYTSLSMSGYAAEQAMACASRPQEGERVRCYEHHYLNHLFSQCVSQDWLWAQIFPDLRLLQRHDEAHHTELLHTLRVFLRCSRNAAAAAAELHVHKSTFFYRMNKIVDLIGADIYDGRRLFACELSFYLMDYLEQYDRTVGENV